MTNRGAGGPWPASQLRAEALPVRTGDVQRGRADRAERPGLVHVIHPDDLTPRCMIVAALTEALALQPPSARAPRRHDLRGDVG